MKQKIINQLIQTLNMNIKSPIQLINMDQKNSVKIGRKKIGDRNPIYIIGDIGLTNGGNLERTFKLIDTLCNLGVDAVKFQMIKPDELLGDKKINYTYPTLKKGNIIKICTKCFQN